MEKLQFNIACHKEISNKINIDFFYNTFDNFPLENYTNILNSIVIIFQAINPQSPRKVEEYKRMRRKTKTLELYLILDYERMMQGTDPENLQHIKEVFLKGCETFLMPLKDFKWKEFNDEIQKIIRII